MKAMTAILSLVFSVSVFSASVVECELARPGYQKWSYITFFKDDGSFKAIQFISGSGIFSYYNLRSPEVIIADGDLVMNHFGVDGEISFNTDAAIFNSESETQFEGTATSEKGTEKTVCSLKKMQQFADHF